MGKIISKSPLSNQIFKLKPIRNDLQELNLLNVKKIIANGTYNAEDEGYKGYLSVDVDIPIMHDIKVITTEGIHEASRDGVAGYSQVSVEIPTTSITITPTREEQTFTPEDGTYFHEVIVEPMKPRLQEIHINSFGEFSYDKENYDGIGTATVEVERGNFEDFIEGNTLYTNFHYKIDGKDISFYRNDNITTIREGGFSLYDFSKINNLYLPNCVEIGPKNFLFDSGWGKFYIVLPYNGIVNIDKGAVAVSNLTTYPEVYILVPKTLLSQYKSKYSGLEYTFLNFEAMPEEE